MPKLNQTSICTFSILEKIAGLEHQPMKKILEVLP